MTKKTIRECDYCHLTTEEFKENELGLHGRIWKTCGKGHPYRGCGMDSCGGSPCDMKFLQDNCESYGPDGHDYE